MKNYWHGIIDGYQSEHRLLNSLFSLANSILGISSLKRIYLKHMHLEGTEFINAIFKKRRITLKYDPDKLKHFIKNNRLIIISNHPHGIIDGMILIKMMADIGNLELKIVANESLAPIKSLASNFILVNAFEQSSDHASKHRGVKRLLRIMKRDIPIAIFPAGDVSRFNFRNKKIEDPVWNRTFFKIIKRTDRPILPIYISGRNSLFYHACVFLHPKLGIPILIREFLKTRNIQIEVKIGEIVSEETKILNQESLREKVYCLDINHDQTGLN